MKIGIATHIKSGKQVEFMHFTQGNYENTLNWYERDTTKKMFYGRDEVINDGESFTYYTQEGKRELMNKDWYLVRFGQGDFYDACPRDFKEWYEVIIKGSL